MRVTRQNGPAIRLMRRARGARVSAMAERVGLSANTIYGIENGTRQASWELLGRLQAALDVPLRELLTEAGRDELAEQQAEAVSAR